MSFEATIDVPSLGLLEGAVDKVSINPMTLADEKILFSRKFDLGQKFAQILCNCTDVPKDKVKGLPFNDVMFVFIKLRNLSVGDTNYTFRVPCSMCQSTILHSVNLDSLEVKFLEDAEEPFKVTLPRNGSVLQLRHMRLGDQFQLDKFTKMIRSKGDDVDPRFVAERLAASIVSVNDEEGSFASKVQFAEGLTAVDMSHINSEVVKRDFGLDLRIKSDCPTCFSEEDTIVRIDPSFFRAPERRGDEP